MELEWNWNGRLRVEECNCVVLDKKTETFDLLGRNSIAHYICVLWIDKKLTPTHTAAPGVSNHLPSQKPAKSERHCLSS